jgi:hypothetical protein
MEFQAAQAIQSKHPASMVLPAFDYETNKTANAQSIKREP